MQPPLTALRGALGSARPAPREAAAASADSGATADFSNLARALGLKLESTAEPDPVSFCRSCLKTGDLP